MEKVIAVVVTYNRQALLSECINALRNQTRKPDAILVVNNGSTDTTEQWLQQQTDVITINQKNIGGAGGFSTAIQAGYKKGYEWIWCMDDDGAPKEDALEQLLAVECNDLTLLNCAVINKDDKKSFVWNTGGHKTLDEVPGNIIEGIGHPFNGTFINRRIVERVGVPKAQFFLWGDETEYYYRIVKRNTIPVCTVTGSIHYHPAATFSFKQDWDYKTAWKMYFYIRNRLHIHKAKFSNKIIASINYGCFLAALAGIVLVFQKTDKLKKLSFIFWPATDAVANNFTATPAFILDKLKLKAENTSNSSFIHTVKNIWSMLFTPSTMVKKMQTR
ncbi:glycosyltransferase family 2 protein [Ferruginibacter sp. SUN106]|uniref:glycosyltransferase family 2 protein n=1 Tax=Ferruginibacter sp. SUN106 TaxID=2978348 RepID=UPI003D35D710